MTDSGVFRVYGKAAGCVAMRRREPGFARAAEGWRRRMAPHPARGADRAGRAKKKSRASGPARVDQVGMSGRSVLAPTGHRGQTSQTGAEEEHGGGLGDNRGLGFNNPTKMGDSLSYKLRV